MTYREQHPTTQPATLTLIEGVFAQRRALEDTGSDTHHLMWSLAEALCDDDTLASPTVSVVALRLVDLPSDTAPSDVWRQIRTAGCADEYDRAAGHGKTLLTPPSSMAREGHLTPAHVPTRDETDIARRLIAMLTAMTGVPIDATLAQAIIWGVISIPRLGPTSTSARHTPQSRLAYIRGASTGYRHGVPLRDILIADYDVNHELALRVAHLLLGTPSADGDASGSSSAVVALRTGASPPSPRAVRAWTALLIRATHPRERGNALATRVRCAQRHVGSRIDPLPAELVHDLALVGV